MLPQTLLVIFATILPSIISAQSIDCEFTRGNYCGWVVDSPSSYMKVQTMQEEQPPTELRTVGAFDSDYIYISMGQMATKSFARSKLRLLSPYFETTTFGNHNLPKTRCFSFWYRAATFKRSIPASFSFGLNSGGDDFFTEEIPKENANVWRYKQVDVFLKRHTDQIRLMIDSGDTFFSYVAFDHFHLSPESCSKTIHVLQKYRNLGGNCPGEYLSQFSQPIGCFSCSLEECLQTCEAFAFCRGVSWADRKALNAAFPSNSQCYLKTASCWPDIVKYKGGYKYYERTNPRTNKTMIHDHDEFEVLPILPQQPKPFLAPGPAASVGEMSKWLPRNAKETKEYPPVIRWQKPQQTQPRTPSPSPFHWMTTGEFGSKFDPIGPLTTAATPTTTTEKTTTTTTTPTTTTTTTTPTTTTMTTTTTTTTTTTPKTTSTTTEGTTITSRYALVPSPFPNSSKHVFGYVPLQPFGNCGGHFIIDENHQYLGCTRCSFAQCATLCSLSQECRGFSFTESILVAKQCYLKTAATCEPQPSSTGFKYFIKVRKSPKEQQGAEASNGRNGIGAFTIKPVMPKQTPNSEQESKEYDPFSTSAINKLSGVTAAPWYISTGFNIWSNVKYVKLGGNCAGAFLRDTFGEAVTCPRCSLPACEKLCDQDDECRGVSYSDDNSVAVQCYLKTIDNCSPLSTLSGYTFYSKKTY